MKIIVSVFMLLFSSTALATQPVKLPQAVKTQDGFVIYLPANWVEIPSAALKKNSETLSQLAPRAKRQSYNYGFQLSSAKKWLTYPYILIQVNRMGRITENELKKYKKTKFKISRDINETENKMSGIVSNADFNQTVYDPENRMLWMNLTMDVQSVGTIKGQVALKLTQFGVIQIMGYATEDTFSAYQPLFVAIARKMTLDDAIAYKPGDNTGPFLFNVVSTRNILIVAGAGAIIGAVIGLIALSIKIAKIKKTRQTETGEASRPLS